ncbi:MAG: flagellar M-ring protein FliF [Thermoleophilia bacterium]|nr:flagellar M-ring protein FliF [Thermoleophilia bacterium]
MADATSKLREIWSGLETKGQLTVIGSAVAVVAVFFLLFTYASKPSYSTLYTGLDLADANNITRALSAAGIPYRLTAGGTEVDVQSGKEAQAQVALAAKGLPSSGHVGFEIFDKQSLGATEFQQQVNYQRALEGELDRTLMQISGITNADVQLVIPQDSLFADQATKASASALLTTSQPLDASTVRGIAHLIAGAVKGLSPDDVTLTDQTGNLLWPQSAAAGSSAAAATIEANQQYASQLSSAINAMLTQTLGPGKAQARVHADLNVDQTTLDKITYGKGTPTSSSTDTEQLRSKGGGTALPAGASSNIPGYANASGGINSSSNYQHKIDNTQFGVDRTVEHTVVAPGKVNRLDIALLVDTSVPAAQANALERSVAAMAGLDRKRGDTITLSRLSFAKTAAPAAPAKKGPLANPLGLAKYVLAAVGALVFLFLMRRGLKRREGEAVAEPVWLREIEGPTPIAELEVAPVRTALDPAQERRATVRAEVEDIVRREPEQVAAQIGQWLKE